MDRRQFIKICMVAFAGVFLSKLTGLLSFGQKQATQSPLKEARFYRSGRHLAG